MYVRIIYFCMYFIVFSILLTSCQTEDLYVKNDGNGTKSGVNIKHLKGFEAKKAENLLKSVLGKPGGLHLGSNETMREGETTIDYNNILLVLDTLGIKNYTFKVVNHPNDNYKTFHNLVLTEKDGSLELAVMKYEMTDVFANDYNSFLKTFHEFEGKISALGLSDALDPCSEISVDYPTNPSDPDGDGDGSGGGNEAPPTDDPGGILAGGGGASWCVSMVVRFVCSCGRNYNTWDGYLNSMCGDGSNPGYTLTVVISYTLDAGCRLAGDPCSPDGVIGVVDPKEEDCNTSKEDLMNIFPNLTEENAEILANAINDYGDEYGIDNKYKLRHFLSQIGHETGGLESLNRSENLNYSADRLLEVFPKYFSYTDPTKENPNNYAGNQSKIANLIYCCGRMGNGDVQSEDGYRYRGRGLIQLTGKSNYQSFQNFYNEKYEQDLDIMNDPDIVTNNSEVAIISAMWYFQNRVINKTHLASGFDDPVREITRKVNGGLNGLTDRISYYNNCTVNIDCN